MLLVYRASWCDGEGRVRIFKNWESPHHRPWNNFLLLLFRRDVFCKALILALILWHYYPIILKSCIALDCNKSLSRAFDNGLRSGWVDGDYICLAEVDLFYIKRWWALCTGAYTSVCVKWWINDPKEGLTKVLLSAVIWSIIGSQAEPCHPIWQGSPLSCLSCCALALSAFPQSVYIFG